MSSAGKSHQQLSEKESSSHTLYVCTDLQRLSDPGNHRWRALGSLQFSTIHAQSLLQTVSSQCLKSLATHLYRI